MQRSNAATRRFYSAFYRWSILNSKPALSHRAAPGLHRNKSDIRKRVESSFRLSEFDSEGRGISATTEVEDKGVVREDGDDLQRKTLAASVKSGDSQETGSKHAYNYLRNAPLRPSQDHPFETLKPGQFAVRFRSDAGLMIEVPLPRNQLSAAQENLGQDLERLSESTNARLEVRSGISPTGESSQDLMSVLVSGPYESVRKAYRTLIKLDNPNKKKKVQDVSQTGLTNRISVADRLSPKTKEELAPSRIPPWHLAVRSRSGSIMTVEYCIPWEVWASFSAGNNVDDVSTSTGAKVEVGGSYVYDGAGPESGKMTRCVLLSGDSAKLKRAQAWFSACGPPVHEHEAQEPVERPLQGTPGLKAETIIIERLSVPDGLRKHIFGQGGAILRGIRDESGCGRIMFRNGTRNEPGDEYLRIQGTRPQVDAAKAHMQRNFDRACTLGGREMVQIVDMAISEDTFVMPRTHWARVRLPHGRELIGWVKGKDGERFRRMEKDDDCRINKTTSPNAPHAIILIVGPKSAVTGCLKKLQILVDRGCERDGLAAAKIEVLEEGETPSGRGGDASMARKDAGALLTDRSRPRSATSTPLRSRMAPARSSFDVDNELGRTSPGPGRFVIAAVPEASAKNVFFGQYEDSMNKVAVHHSVGIAALDPPVEGQRLFYIVSETGSQDSMNTMLHNMRAYLRAFANRTEENPAEISIVQPGGLNHQGYPLGVSAKDSVFCNSGLGSSASATGSEEPPNAKPIQDAKVPLGFDAGAHRTIRQYKSFMIIAVVSGVRAIGLARSSRLGRIQVLPESPEGRVLIYLQADNLPKLHRMHYLMQVVHDRSLAKVGGEPADLEILEMGEGEPTVVDLPAELEKRRLNQAMSSANALTTISEGINVSTSSTPDVGACDLKLRSVVDAVADTPAHNAPAAHQSAESMIIGTSMQPTDIGFAKNQSSNDGVPAPAIATPEASKDRTAASAPATTSPGTNPDDEGVHTGEHAVSNISSHATPPAVYPTKSTSTPFGIQNSRPATRSGDTKTRTKDLSTSVVLDTSASQTTTSKPSLSAQEVKGLADSSRAAVERLSQYEKQQVMTLGVPETSASKRTTAVSESSARETEEAVPKLSEQQAQNVAEPLRVALRRLTHPVVVVTARFPCPRGQRGDHSLQARGVTVSSFSAVTLSPRPIVSFNIKVPSRTWDAIGSNGSICAHILAASPEGAAIAHVFTQPYEEAHEPFVRLRTAGATVQIGTGSTPPKIKSWGAVLARVHAHIRPAQCVTVGDHVIVVADVYDVQTGVANDMDDAIALAYGMKGYRSRGESLQPLELLGNPTFTPLNPKTLHPPSAPEAMSVDSQEKSQQVDSDEQAVDVSQDTNSSQTPASLAEEYRAQGQGTASSTAESVSAGEDTRSAVQTAGPSHLQAAAEPMPSDGEKMDQQGQQGDLDSQIQNVNHESNLWEALASEPEEGAEEQDAAGSATDSVKQDPAAAEERKTDDQTQSQVQTNEVEEGHSELTEGVVSQTEHVEKSAKDETQPAGEVRESESAEMSQTANAEAQETGAAGSSSQQDSASSPVDSREAGELEAETPAEPTAAPPISEEHHAPDRASAALPGFNPSTSQPIARASTAKYAAPNAWGLPNSTRAYTTSARLLTRSYSTKNSPDFPTDAPADPALLKSTAEDFLCAPHNLGPRLKPMVRAKQAAEQATRRLSLALSDGTLTPEESAELETTITANERKVVKGIALRSAIDLSAMLDKGRVDPRRVGFWETSVERGQAVLLEEAKEARRKFDRLEMSGKDFQAVKQKLEGEYEKYNNALVRLRESADEEDD